MFSQFSDSVKLILDLFLSHAPIVTTVEAPNHTATPEPFLKRKHRELVAKGYHTAEAFILCTAFDEAAKQAAEACYEAKRKSLKGVKPEDITLKYSNENGAEIFTGDANITDESFKSSLRTAFVNNMRLIAEVGIDSKQVKTNLAHTKNCAEKPLETQGELPATAALG